MSLVAAYALLGATWLIMKTEGELQQHAVRLAWKLGVATLVAVAAVSLATPFLEGAYFERWLSWPNILKVAPVPLLVVVVAVVFASSLKRGAERAPFLLTLALFALCFVGLGISIFPYVIPGAVTIWDAATDRSSQVFMLIGTAVLVPIILAYTAWAYWVFRGKVKSEGYH